MADCPHCTTTLTEHTNSVSKPGALHCQPTTPGAGGCGCCFESDGTTMRGGWNRCSKGGGSPARIANRVTAAPWLA